MRAIITVNIEVLGNENEDLDDFEQELEFDVGDAIEALNRDNNITYSIHSQQKQES